MIIDTDNLEASGVKSVLFPGGEMHVEVPTNVSVVHVFAKVRSPQDALLVAEILSAYKQHKKDVYLFAPYFPGARQDRVQPGFGFTVDVYNRLFSDARTITVADIHSEKALEVLVQSKRVFSLHFREFVPKLNIRKPDVVLVPDKGAVSRGQAVAAILGVGDVRFCEKTRDPITGKLSGFKVPSLKDINNGSTENASVLIVDDICDGGGTFLGISEAIRRDFGGYYYPRMELYVTHGIFSQGFDRLAKHFRMIYTTDSFYNGNSEIVKSVGLLQPYLESLRP